LPLNGFEQRNSGRSDLGPVFQIDVKGKAHVECNPSANFPIARGCHSPGAIALVLKKHSGTRASATLPIPIDFPEFAQARRSIWADQNRNKYVKGYCGRSTSTFLGVGVASIASVGMARPGPREQTNNATRANKQRCAEGYLLAASAAM
jgi:hypothetical protein